MILQGVVEILQGVVEILQGVVEGMLSDVFRGNPRGIDSRDQSVWFHIIITSLLRNGIFSQEIVKCVYGPHRFQKLFPKKPKKFCSKNISKKQKKIL